MRTCKICGKEFVPSNSNEKTCSPECHDENQRRVKNAGARRYYAAHRERLREYNRLYMRQRRARQKEKN